MIEIIFIRKEETSDKKEIVEREFFDKKKFSSKAKFSYRRISDKENLWNKELTFDFILLFF